METFALGDEVEVVENLCGTAGEDALVGRRGTVVVHYTAGWVTVDLDGEDYLCLPEELRKTGVNNWED